MNQPAIRTSFAVAGALILSIMPAFSQTPEMTCKDQHFNNRGQSCEVRESTMPVTGQLRVDGKQNGGIRVHGANRSDILVRAMVQAGGTNDTDAHNRAAQVIVHATGGSVSADGPARTSGDDNGWSVTYEIFAPMNTNLLLTTHNGGVSVTAIQSLIEFHTVNGGVHLKEVGGDVRGETNNGGVTVELAGTKWNGKGMDVSTTNGGVRVQVPQSFSAQLDVATVNGGMRVDLPNVTMQKGSHSMLTTVGAGGPLIRVRTRNGGVTVGPNGRKA